MDLGVRLVRAVRSGCIKGKVLGTLSILSPFRQDLNCAGFLTVLSKPLGGAHGGTFLVSKAHTSIEFRVKSVFRCPSPPENPRKHRCSRAPQAESFHGVSTFTPFSSTTLCFFGVIRIALLDWCLDPRSGTGDEAEGLWRRRWVHDRS